MDYSYHIIKNFPKNYPLRMKIAANVMFFFGTTIIHPRKNLLNKDDIKSVVKTLKKGDLVLVGNFRRLSHLVIRGPVTHAMLYIGGRKLIHATADGVEIDSLHRALCEYDTMAILRPKTGSKNKIKKTIEYAQKQLGKPFDYEFKNDEQKFYCSELILDALKAAKIHTKLTRTKKAFHPKNFLKGNFQLVFKSHNL